MTDEERHTAQIARRNLLDNMLARSKKADEEARKSEKWITPFITVAALVAVVATIAGLIAGVPSVKAAIDIEPWMISVCSIIAAAIEAFRQRMAWRKVADANYALRDTTDDIVANLRDQMLDPTPEQVAQMSRQFQAAKREFGMRMNRINAGKEGDGTAAISAPTARPDL